MAVRAAEWSLGYEIKICVSAHKVGFVKRNPETLPRRWLSCRYQRQRRPRDLTSPLYSVHPNAHYELVAHMPPGVSSLAKVCLTGLGFRRPSLSPRHPDRHRQVLTRRPHRCLLRVLLYKLSTSSARAGPIMHLYPGQQFLFALHRGWETYKVHKAVGTSPVRYHRHGDAGNSNYCR